ncbi:ABC transporter substrate-binding protein [Virgibacillus sp. W0181]|uniref:ABC transporter substrate-binding protein n=1 Tax=Virgibacillus sp. W0181 TaxID=3391581 RepID=UPI003F46DCAD
MKKFKLFGSLIMIALLTMFLIACGGDSNNTESEGEATETETAEPEAEEAEEGEEEEATEDSGDLQEVKLVVPRTVEVLDDAHVWSAIKMGYFEEEGLKVSIEESFGTTDVKMVSTGNADFALPAPNFILMSIENELPIKAVFQNDWINIFGMAVLEDSDIETWEDMKGKTVALGDASWEDIINPVVIAAGLDPDKDLEYVVAGENRFQAVQEGEIDILFTWVGEVTELQGRGFDFEYIDGNEVLPYASNPLVTSLDNIENNPEMVEGFARGLAKGMYFVKENPEAAADIVLGQFPSIDITWDGAVGAMLGRVKQGFGISEEEQQERVDEGIGLASEEKWGLNVEWALKTDSIKEEIPLDRIFTNEFVDTSWDLTQVEEDAANYEFKVKDQYE